MVPSIRVNLMKDGKARSWLDPCFHTCVEERRERESFECIWTHKTIICYSTFVQGLSLSVLKEVHYTEEILNFRYVLSV